MTVSPQMHRDPRFDDLSGEYKSEIFNKTYNFINDIKQREKKVIFQLDNRQKLFFLNSGLIYLDSCLFTGSPEAAEEDEDERREEGEAAVPPQEDGESSDLKNSKQAVMDQTSMFLDQVTDQNLLNAVQQNFEHIRICHYIST